MSTDTSLNKTALYDWHISKGAKMVGFAGYWLPVQYTAGVLKEHFVVRESCGLFDISHMLQTIIKPKDLSMIRKDYVDEVVIKEIENVFPMDIASLNPGKAKYGYILNENGGIIDDLIITRRNDDFFLVSNASRKTQVLSHLKKYLNNFVVEPTEKISLVAVQGVDSAKVMYEMFPSLSGLKFMDSIAEKFFEEDIYISRLGYTGEDGFEISIPDSKVVEFVNKLIELKVVPCGLGARDSLRLESGLCLYGNDLTEETTPVEAAISMFSRKTLDQKPAIGGDVILEQKAIGITKKRIGLTNEFNIPMRKDVVLCNDADENIGYVTSGTMSPLLRKPVAMAYVNIEYAKGERPIYALIRENKVLCQIEKMPFVSSRYCK